MNRHHISAFFVGLVFGLGLLVSGLANPARVLAFLDLAGAWDPSLALVMGAAVAVGLIAFALVRGRSRAMLGGPIRLPEARQPDRRLVLGSLAFGVGWGMAGFCPGPSLVALGAGEIKAAIFVVAMLAGMGLFETFERQRLPRADA